MLEGIENGKWVIKQLSDRRGKQQELNLTFEDELRLHQHAYAIIERARTENPRKKYARIPMVYSLLRDAGKQWLLMEYLNGETLFERALRATILTYTTDDEERTIVERMRKEELLNELVRSYGAEFDESHFKRFVDEAYRYSKTPVSILTRSQHTALKNTIEELHRHGLHHRDLHASNVMTLDNGEVGILDFGAAAERDPKSIEADTMYTLKVQMLDERTRKRTSLLPDTTMVDLYARIVR